jgi:amino acid transporter
MLQFGPAAANLAAAAAAAAAHSITFVGIIYTLMSLCLVMMVPYHALDPAASFATAFTQVGMPWGQYLVALGAVLGIVTGVLVGVVHNRLARGLHQYCGPAVHSYRHVLQCKSFYCCIPGCLMSKSNAVSAGATLESQMHVAVQELDVLLATGLR